MKKKKRLPVAKKKTKIRVELRKVDVDLLWGLIGAREVVPALKGWLTPMFLGGSDGSQHSGRLKKLVAAGLVERKRRGGHSRPSFLYRITPAGRRVAKSRKLPRALQARKARTRG